MSSRERTAWVISSTIEYADYTASPKVEGRSSKFELTSHFDLPTSNFLRCEASTDGISELRRARRAFEVACSHTIISKHGAERLHDPVGHGRFADVAQHQQCREQERHWIGDVAACDIG